MTKEEEDNLLSELADHLKPIVICALQTGLRRGNILNLRWEQVDIVSELIIIEKQNNKGHKDVQIPISAKLMNELKK